MLHYCIVWTDLFTINNRSHSGLNIFFIAVYQSIYQSNTLTPALSFPPAVLITFFMVAPILMILVAGLLIVRGLALDAERGD